MCSSGGFAVKTTRETRVARAYIWNSAKKSGNWDDPANWLVDGAETEDYPSTSSDTAAFSEGTTATVALTTKRTIGKLDLSANGIDVTFANGAASLEASKLTVNDIDMDKAKTGTGGSFTLDGVSFQSNVETYLGLGRKFKFVNGAYLYLPNAKSVWPTAEGSEFWVTGGSTANITGALLVGPGLVLIDDSTVTLTWQLWFCGSSATLRFLGANPLLKVGAQAAYFDSASSSDTRLEFAIPKDGYATIPLQIGSSLSGTGNRKITVDVMPSSPAKLEGKPLQTTLVKASSIDTATVLEGNLPGSPDRFVWTGTTTLGVDLASLRGFMLIVR